MIGTNPMIGYRVSRIQHAGSSHPLIGWTRLHLYVWSCLCWVACGVACGYAPGQAQLQEVDDFGPNPGNLRMWVYAPAGSPAEPLPLLVAMHGCGQSVTEFAQEAGWNELADRLGFVVIYPEQRRVNNPSKCFNWFLPSDQVRGQGEAASIRSMLQQAQQQWPIDGQRVFVTGFSAGGAMSSVMLATYPEAFQAGAVMAGLPYQAARSSWEAITAMAGGVNRDPEGWAELVQAQLPDYEGPFPRVVVFHGSRDAVVSFLNVQELIDQWTAVHGTDPFHDELEEAFLQNEQVRRRSFTTESGQVVVQTYTFLGLGHRLAVDPGTGNTQAGEVGTYAEDVDLAASYWAAEFFGLTESMTTHVPFRFTAGKRLQWLKASAKRAELLVRGPSGPVLLELFNLQGQRLRSWKLIASPGKSIRLDLQGIADGLYVLCLDQRESVKLLLQP